MSNNQPLFVFNENSHLQGIIQNSATLHRFNNASKSWQLDNVNLEDEDTDPLEKEESDYLQDEIDAFEEEIDDGDREEEYSVLDDTPSDSDEEL